MGSKGGVPPPPPPPPPVVCCMCGDHGLPQELFRCKVCLLRSQHKYCSDLYPKVETYRACNWCLREEGAKPAPKEEVVDNHKNSISSSNNISSSGNGGGTSGLKLHRGAFSTQLNKPIKKQRLLNRSMSDVTERLRSEEVSRSLVKGRPVFRGKVRRYKLLEEVSS